jgi:signal transduction histidine kinase/CheY-like chemotaxis protein
LGYLQRIVKERRTYNQWVADQTLEDYALRFTAESSRKWSSFILCNTALGSISFLACEAIGGSITISYGFRNSLTAFLIIGFLTFIVSLPISYYAARFGVDMDLLTRGAGFGYIGSTLTSLIYASFTFILFAVEATILSQALDLCLGIPLPIGHLISALIILPIAILGMKMISKFQIITQPLWLVLQLAPLAYLIFIKHWNVQGWSEFSGIANDKPDHFSLLPFGFASAILLSFLPQIGEQVDYLRFLPNQSIVGKKTWWISLLLSGPGWVIIGTFKFIAGSYLAYVAIHQGLSALLAVQPSQIYLIAFEGLFQSQQFALFITGFFILICQTKINVTNAYAGSIAWSNFFSRITHSHPGRVVWLVFNVVLALLLMEVGVFSVINSLLVLYANFAVGWIGALTADLMINKPLGLSPSHIEFRRAYLYKINPVGTGAMGFSVTISTLSLFGVFGDIAQSLAPVIGFCLSFCCAPLIAYWTKGRYYMARESEKFDKKATIIQCMICENSFETQDMAQCPAYGGFICSLCCSLDRRCHDRCKTPAPLFPFIKRYFIDFFNHSLGRFLKVFIILDLSAFILLAFTYFEYSSNPQVDKLTVLATLKIVFVGLQVVMGLASWIIVLEQESWRLAEEETQRQTCLLLEEIKAHETTDLALQKAKEVAEAANLAKTRFIGGLNHEIRSLLNSINGYAQLLQYKSAKSPDEAVRVIYQSSEHITKLMDELLDISHVESGTLTLYRNIIDLHDFLDQVVTMVSLQASAKALKFDFVRDQNLPKYVYSDEKRLRQILLNLMTNAIKYTPSGQASLSVHYRSQIAEFNISDTGIGIDDNELDYIFEPFGRGKSATTAGIPGTGLGLTITRLLVHVLGGDIAVTSRLGEGTNFKVKLMMSEAPLPYGESTKNLKIIGYHGKRRTIVSADDNYSQINLLSEILVPLGFQFFSAKDGLECLETVQRHHPDILILDISMPKLNGWEVASKLRELGYDDLAILLLSAENLKNTKPQGQSLAHDDHLMKPFLIADLLDRLHTLLDLEWIYEQQTSEAG